MARFHATPEGNVPFTAAEESARDAEELAEAAAAPAREAERTRHAAIDSAIQSDTTIASLKAMTNAEFDTWWAANITGVPQAIAVLKRLARLVIRRVL